MSMEELFSGVAVVIDDEVNNSSANITNIVNQIEYKSIPVLKYTSLPEDSIINHFQNLSFLLLDWRLIKVNMTDAEIEEGITMPDNLLEDDAKENVEFIKKLNEKCFCPIFIFTNEDKSSIESKLKEEGLITDGKPSNLFVESKSELQDDQTLFEKISEWLEITPSIYVLKEWEKEYQNCKTKLFSEFHTLNPFWPAIMWNNFDHDGANKSLEMGELISKNLHSRMTPFEFKDEILSKNSEVPSKEDLRKVLEGERYLKKESLHADDVGTGDIFKEETQRTGQTQVRYYLNIRAQCDLLRDLNPSLYLISGYVLEQKENGKIENISFRKGEYLEKLHHSIVAFLDDGKIIEFKFSEFEIKSWSELKGSRTGRLLPPYINRIQQRYSLYMQRQGVLRIPEKAIFD